jgi:formylglycine-generating enzyme required for sulfatase activity
MGGNVSEWTASPYAAYPDADADAGKFDPEKRVIRGGSWRYGAGYARCANRDASKPGERYPETGLRCVKDVPEWLGELK